jgi:EmrB/QacA subfamily drug resistance transporter
MTAEPTPADAPTGAPAPVVLPHGRSPWSVLPPLLAGFFMIMVDTTIVNIAVPTLVSTFDATLVQVGWVTSAYLLTFATLLLVTGRLGDAIGPKPVFVAGLIVFTVASLGAGLAPSIHWLVVARAVQGIGSALMTPQTMAIITRVFPPAKRGAALGLWGSVAGVATITGPLLGGVLVETVGWEWIFYVNLPVGVVALWFALTRLPDLPTHPHRFDGVGVGLSVVGMFLLVFGIQEGATYDWGEIRWGVTVWELIGAGVVLLLVFGWWQLRRGEAALVPMRLFGHRNFLLANVAGASVSFAMIGIFFPLTIFLQEIMGLSPIRAALVALPGSLVSGAVAPIAGRLSDRVPGKWVVAFGFAAFAVSIVWASAWVDAGTSPWRLMAPMALFGLGTGSVFSPLANLATSGLDHRTAGAGAGAFNTNRQVGGVIGSAAIVAMLTSRLTTTIPAAAVDASAALPEAYRDQFVDGFRQASGGGFGSGSIGDLQRPAGIPAEAVDAIRSAALQAVGNGFATAVAQTLLLAAAVIVVGLLASLAMHATRPHGAHGHDQVTDSVVAEA